jgi:hypothetical protein
VFLNLNLDQKVARTSVSCFWYCQSLFLPHCCPWKHSQKVRFLHPNFMFCLWFANPSTCHWTKVSARSRIQADYLQSNYGLKSIFFTLLFFSLFKSFGSFLKLMETLIPFSLSDSSPRKSQIFAFTCLLHTWGTLFHLWDHGPYHWLANFLPLLLSLSS